MNRHSLLSFIVVAGLAMSAQGASELLWDMEHISETNGGAKLTLHHPRYCEISIVHDEPWEGNVCAYHTILYDGVKYRMYYRGMADMMPGWPSHQVTCYAESDDGIHWVKPKLGLCEYNGSKENNIILLDENAIHNFSPCYDTNPDCPPEERYKALGGVVTGLWLFISADGIHWKRAQEDPVITKGLFDSQNTIFYDPLRKCYMCYSRQVQPNVGRAVQCCSSPDAYHWTDPVFLEYGAEDIPCELYTNAVHPYVLNGSFYIGLPKRFHGARVSEYDHTGGDVPAGVSDGGFMTSRDGVHFHRWNEAFIRPGIQHERWVNRNNMSACGVVLTHSDLEGAPDELSIYSTEGYYSPNPDKLRRFTIRQDGFVSMQAPMSGGGFTMKPVTVAPEGGAARKAPELPNQIVERNGRRVLKLEDPVVWTMPVSDNLGKQATFAITIDKTQANNLQRRLFSSYAGGSQDAGERKFIIDMQAGQLLPHVPVLRFLYDGMEAVITPADYPDWVAMSAGPLAIVATYDDGVMKLYLNGKMVAEGGEAGHGDLITPLGPVRFAEDYPPTSTDNEAYKGEVAEIAIVTRVLSAEEVAKAAQEGLQAVLTPGTDSGVHYDMAGPDLCRLVNRLNPQQQPISFGSKTWGDVMLLLNASTSGLGDIRCEIRDEQNNPIPGFTLEESVPVFGDELDLIMKWNNGCELKSLVGRQVILHFEMRDADIYSFHFGQPQR